MKRPRYQKGFFSRLKRKSGPDVWMYRWWEIGPKGEARMRKQVIGTLQQYPSKTAAWRAVELLRLDINYEAPRPESLPANFGELIGHYRKIELDRSQPQLERPTKRNRSTTVSFARVLNRAGRSTALEKSHQWP